MALQSAIARANAAGAGPCAHRGRGRQGAGDGAGREHARQPTLRRHSRRRGKAWLSLGKPKEAEAAFNAPSPPRPISPMRFWASPLCGPGAGTSRGPGRIVDAVLAQPHAPPWRRRCSKALILVVENQREEALAVSKRRWRYSPIIYLRTTSLFRCTLRANPEQASAQLAPSERCRNRMYARTTSMHAHSGSQRGNPSRGSRSDPAGPEGCASTRAESVARR
jgi:hypothetical protein